MIDPVRLDPVSVLPVLQVRVGDLPRKVIVVGDPNRAARAAEKLDNTRELGSYREYFSYAGDYNGVEIGVVSHGVGSAGAAVCFEELCRSGVDTIIRAGSAGGLQPDVVDGHLVIATAAVRNDGFSPGVVPPEFPAVADHDVTTALIEATGDAGRPVHRGIVLTSSVFYPHSVLGSALPQWQQAGVVAVEMEAAALLIIASLHRVAAGAIFAIDGNPLLERDEQMSGYDPHRDIVREAVDSMLDFALVALASLS
ncbi:MAG: nucleoside phosphorylase [Acidimicrobiia bacterium]